MKNRTAYPADTATGACLITRSSRVKPGETVIDLQMDCESLPSFGRLCVHEDGVRLLVTQLGWQLRDPAEDERVEQMRSTMAELRAEITSLRDSLRAVFAAGEQVGVELPGARCDGEHTGERCAAGDQCWLHDPAEVVIG